MINVIRQYLENPFTILNPAITVASKLKACKASALKNSERRTNFITTETRYKTKQIPALLARLANNSGKKRRNQRFFN